jgi:Domain of unknown function (DUF4149)
MTQAAAAIRTLAVALWVGGMAALDVIDAPVRFGSPFLNRNQAVGIGQEIFARFNRVEVVLAAVALVSAVVAGGAPWTTGLLVLMGVVVGIQAVYLTPGITRLARGLDFVNRTPGDPRYAAIRPLHTAYAVLELVLLAAGMVVLAAWSRPGRR